MLVLTVCAALATIPIPYEVGRTVLSLNSGAIAVCFNATPSTKLVFFDGAKVNEKLIQGTAVGSSTDGEVCSLDITFQSWGMKPENYDNPRKLFGELFLEHGVLIQRQRTSGIQIRLQSGTWQSVGKLRSFDGFAINPSGRTALLWGDPIVDPGKHYYLVDLVTGKTSAKTPIATQNRSLVRHNGNIVFLDERYAVFVAKPESFKQEVVDSLPSVLESRQKGFVSAVVCLIDTESGHYMGCYRVFVEGREFEGGSLDRERLIGRLSESACAVLGFETLVSLPLGVQIRQLRSMERARKSIAQLPGS